MKGIECAARMVCRPDRPRSEAPTAIRAHIVEPALHAIHAECALITADARLHGFSRKVLVAVSQFGRISSAIATSVARDNSTECSQIGKRAQTVNRYGGRARSRAAVIAACSSR